MQRHNFSGFRRPTLAHAQSSVCPNPGSQGPRLHSQVLLSSERHLRQRQLQTFRRPHALREERPDR